MALLFRYYSPAAATVTPNFKSYNITLKSPSFPTSASFPIRNFTSASRIFCRAAKSQTGSVNNDKKPSSSSSSSKKKKKKKKKNAVGADDSEPLNPNDFELLSDFSVGADVQNDAVNFGSSFYHPHVPLPQPPTGFVLHDNGRVTLSSTNRLTTVVDPSNNLPLECVIRRVFKSSDRDECMLLCPVDTPVQILKSSFDGDGWSAISDEEVESILPAAAYALAKIHMHLVYSGYCYTARGGFCYTEEDIIDFDTDDDGKVVDGLPTQAVEITYFNLEGARYMIYTPSDPLLFVAVKGENGLFQIADDELLEDPAVIDAIDEETEFNALVEEEAAIIEATMDES